MRLLTQLRHRLHGGRQLGVALLIAAMGLPFVSSTTAAQADEWEWDPTWGYHQEEWYDPSDWFNADDGYVDYEDYYYGDYYDDDGVLDDGTYDNPYGYDYYTSDWFDDDADFDGWWGT
jgi:hypothetical protein